MSLDSLLIHTCTIENPAAGPLNALNNAKKGYATPLENVRCRLIENREVVRTDEVTEGVIQSVYTLIVPGNVDLKEKGKVSKVTLEDGTELSDVFEVGMVLHRRGRNSHHKSATLERIS